MASSSARRAAKSDSQGVHGSEVKGVITEKDCTPESIEVMLESSMMAGVGGLHGRQDSSFEAFRTAVTICEISADIVGVIVGVIFAYEIYARLGLGTNTHYKPVQIALACSVLSLC